MSDAGARDSGSPLAMKRTKTAPKSARKPSQERAHATVEAILEASARIIEREGLGRSFGTNRIAREAGVSIGSVYEYFESKDAIVAELCARHVRGVRALIDSAFRELRDMEVGAAIGIVVDGLFALHGARPDLQRALTHEYARRQGLEPFIASDRYTEDLLVAWLATRLPEVPHEELETRAFVAIRSARNVTIHTFAEELPVDRRERVRAAVKELLLRTLGLG